MSSVKTNIEIMVTNYDDLNEKILKKAEKSRSYFAEKFLGIQTYPYQEDVLESSARYIVVLFGRQLGKTVIGIIYILHTMNMYPGSRVGILANGKHRAKEIYAMVHFLQSNNPILRDRITTSTQSDLIITQKIKNSKGELFDRHSHLSFYASGNNTSQIRGVSLDGLMLDEVEFTSGKALDSATPTVSATGGWIFQSSTPGFHKYSQFYILFNSAWDHKKKYLGLMALEPDEKKPTSPIFPETGYEAFHTIYKDILDVINPVTGRPQVSLEYIMAEKFKNEDSYTREYLAQWLDGSSTFFPHENLMACLVPAEFKPTIQGEKRVVMGLDFARRHDYTAIVIVHVYPDQPLVHVVFSWMQNRVSWEEILNNVIRYTKMYGVEHIIYDPNGIGDVISEWFKKTIPNADEYTYESVSFQNNKASNLKAELYGNLKFGIALKKVLINNELSTLVDQLKHMVETTSTATTESTRLSITAPVGMKDDLADALVLACKNQLFTYTVNLDTPTVYKNNRRIEPDLMTERMNVIGNNKNDVIEEGWISDNPDIIEYEDDDFDRNF